MPLFDRNKITHKVTYLLFNCWGVKANMYNTNSGLKSLPLSPCDLQSSNMVYFAVRGLQDQTTVSLSLITSEPYKVTKAIIC